MAGIGKVALMQEPVAAVMSAMRARNTDGMFLIYDLGGGTLDIAIAESINGRVNLLEHSVVLPCAVDGILTGLLWTMLFVLGCLRNSICRTICR